MKERIQYPRGRRPARAYPLHRRGVARAEAGRWLPRQLTLSAEDDSLSRSCGRWTVGGLAPLNRGTEEGFMDTIHQVVDLFLHLDAHLASVLSTYGAGTYLILFAIIFAETGLVVT